MDVFDLLQANYLQGYWNTNPQYTAPYLGDMLFPAQKQLSDNVRFITGQDSLPATLNAVTPGAKAIPIERNGLNTQYAQALRFKNSMIVNENDIDQLRQAQATNDPNLLAEILNHIYQDQAKLGVRAHYTREKLIMQALTTGKLTFQDNGAYSDVDYGFDSTQFQKASTAWSNTSTADPYKDIDKLVNTAAQTHGVSLTRAIMNRTTFNNLVANTKLRASLLQPNQSQGILLASTVEQFFASQFGISILIYDKGDNSTGSFTKFIPDGKIVFMSGAASDPVGNTVFVPTAEEREQSALDGQVAIVDTGVAFHTYTSPDPVGLTTKVSQFVVPVLTAAQTIYVLTTEGV